VGCGSKHEGAQFCLFEANDDTLAKFTDRGSLYTTNTTFGNVDGNIVWQPENVSANMYVGRWNTAGRERGGGAGRLPARGQRLVSG